MKTHQTPNMPKQDNSGGTFKIALPKSGKK